MTNKFRHQITLSSLMRHAFMSGAGYGDLDKISEADQARWVEYDPPQTGRMKDLIDAIERPTPKAPQDMSLRELFDHVAIVNDAIRAALLTHPGMTPR